MDTQEHAHPHQLTPVPSPGADMAAVVAASGGGGTAGLGGGPTGGGSAIRPGSMAERARLAKIPQPEPGLKCPRCESTDTKFCYYNNYSLSDPRYFCKTCRRYWTRCGTLRDVPAGRRCNKRSSSAASASGGAGGTSSSTSSTATGAAIMPPHRQLPFLASLHHPLASGGDHYGTGASRLGFPGLSSVDPVDYHHQFGAGGCHRAQIQQPFPFLSGTAAAIGLEQWRLPQIQQPFPFLSGRPDTGVPPPMSGIYPFDVEGHGGDGTGFAGHMLGGSKVPGSAGLITQLASVKMEDNPAASAAMASSSPREFLGLPGNLQFWGGGGSGNGASGNNGGDAAGNAGGNGGGGAVAQQGSSWVDLSGFNSSSSRNVL